MGVRLVFGVENSHGMFNWPARLLLEVARLGAKRSDHQVVQQLEDAMRSAGARRHWGVS